MPSIRSVIVAATLCAAPGFASAQDAYVVGVSAAMTGASAATYAPVIEAMRAGCPVVSVDCKAVMEVGGHALSVVPGNDPQGLAAAVLALHGGDRVLDRRLREVHRHALPQREGRLRRVVPRRREARGELAHRVVFEVPREVRRA